jgi:hypothetical protein
MSGSSVPASCTNACPSVAERAEVDRNFAGGAPAGSTWIVERSSLDWWPRDGPRT